MQDNSVKGTLIRVIAQEYPQWYNCTFYILWKVDNLYSFGKHPDDMVATGYLGRKQFEILPVGRDCLIKF